VTAERPVVLGVHLAGWPAVVVDVLLGKYLPPYLAAMSPRQRAEVERMRWDVHAAAVHWRAISDGCSAQYVATETTPPSTHDEITTAQAAGLLGVSERRVCQLAVGWADDGLARKVGRSWLVNRQAVLLHRQRTRSAA
jgi:hypothetical protein